MFEVKQSSSVKLPIRLVDPTSGLGVPGVLYTDVAFTVVKSNGTHADGAPSGGGEFVELTQGSFAAQGCYQLTVGASFTDTNGPLAIAVSATDCKTYLGVVKVVANEEGDTFSRLGAPAGASISADLQIDSAAIAAIKVQTDKLPDDPAAENTLTAMNTRLVRALSLLHENTVIDQTTYNTKGVLTSARVRAFANQTDADAGTNPIGIYTMTVVPKAVPNDSLISTFKMVLIGP